MYYKAPKTLFTKVFIKGGTTNKVVNTHNELSIEINYFIL